MDFIQRSALSESEKLEVFDLWNNKSYQISQSALNCLIQFNFLPSSNQYPPINKVFVIRLLKKILI